MSRFLGNIAPSILSTVGRAAATMQQRPAGPLPSLRAPQVQYVEDFFVYEFDFAGIAPGATVNGNITIQADSDFKLTKLTQFTDIAAAGQDSGTLVVPLISLAIVDTGSGRQLFSAPVPVGAIFGNGTLPFILPVPRIFKARTNISLTFVNYDAANTYNLRTSFIGSKIFQIGGQIAGQIAGQ